MKIGDKIRIEESVDTGVPTPMSNGDIFMIYEDSGYRGWDLINIHTGGRILETRFLLPKVKYSVLSNEEFALLDKSKFSPQSYMLRSGGATGSDSWWDMIGKDYGLKYFFHYYHGERTPKGNVEITESEFEEGKLKVLEANKSLKRNPSKYMDLLARNWMQVKNSEVILAIGELKTDTEVNGGTGWAVQMGINERMPVYVFDQIKNSWNLYDYSLEKFIPIDYIPKLELNFAGIGTRKLNSLGVKAIKDVYISTFGFNA